LELLKKITSLRLFKLQTRKCRGSINDWVQNMRAYLLLDQKIHSL
jgi:hypothetical protein